MGFALVVKQSLFLLPLFYSIIVLVIIIQRRSWKNKLKLNLLRLLVHVLIILFIINAAFLFNRTGQSLSAYDFKSETFQHFQQWGILSKIPLPLPAPFIEGFDRVKYLISIGSGNVEVSGRSYLFGKYFTGNAVWYYYSAVILFKTPLTVLLMLLTVLIAYLKNPLSKDSFFTLGFPLTLAFFFLIFISINNTSQHGLRHLLMIYPLFYVCFGLLIKRLLKLKLMLAAVLLYSVATFYYYFPNLLSYTNELIWNKTNAYKILASSNIDHGQCGYAMENFLKAHPTVKWPGTPEVGEFIVGINDYLDLKQKKEHTWLNNFQPYDHVNHCYLLFRITEKDLVEKKLK
jgi:hypothetical protein